MKKLFSLIIACLSLAFVLSACSKKDNEPVDPTPDPTTATLPEVLTFTVGDVTFKMMKVEKGTFTMGATEEQEDPTDNEKPTHQVTLTKTYYMGETEVTQALWKAVMGNDYNPSSWVGDQMPVQKVSYNEITAAEGFLAKLNAATGRTFRIPTEAEWEFAARGGNKSNKTQYSGSANIDSVAWYRDNSDMKVHEVAQKKANELGLYDMSGNVYEWCSDWYGGYSSDAQTDPTGPATGVGCVIRGGSYVENVVNVRTSHRYAFQPQNTKHYIGFRLCLSAE